MIWKVLRRAAVAGSLLAVAATGAAVGPTPASASVGLTVCGISPDGSRVTQYSYGRWTTLFAGFPGGVVHIYGGGYALFATDAAGEIYGYTGGMNWRHVGGPGAAFVVNDDGLFGITPERDAIVQYSGSGTAWTPIGPAARALYAGGHELYYADAVDGSIHRYLGSPNSWAPAGGPGATFAVADADILYGVTPGHNATAQYSGRGTSWEPIGPGATDLYGGGYGLFAFRTDNTLYHYYGHPYAWEPVSGPAAGFAVTDSGLFRIEPDHQKVDQYEGDDADWFTIGGPMAEIAPCPMEA